MQHEPLNTEEPCAAQTCVTSEEMAKALASIEARMGESARQAEGTLPIGEAVDQLGLETTPEEVLAEIQASLDLPSSLPGYVTLADSRPSSWTIVKYRHHVYLRGWTEHMSEQARKKASAEGTFEMHTMPVLGNMDGSVPVTIRLDGFHAAGSAEGLIFRDRLPVQNVQFDKHAWEKW